MNNKEEYSDLQLLELKKEDKIYTLEELKMLTKNIFEKYGIEKAYIFGSYARKEANKDSDIDILLVGGNIDNYTSFSTFTFELVTVLKKEIDLVRDENYKKKDTNEYFELANKIFYNQICKERILIYG